MANTVIQLKFSTVTATPTALNVAEPAYSYTSNTLFIGTPAGTGSIAIGGKFFLDQQQIIFNTANAAFTAANTGITANLAFNQANAAFITANSAGVYANGAFTAANAAQVTATSAGVYANGAFTAANTAQDAATSAGIYANGAFVKANTEDAINLTQNNSIAAAFTAANTAQVTATSSGVYANGAFVAANTAQNSATAAFTRANNSISANAGGTITGSLVVTGNLTVQGNTTFVDTEILSVEDSLIKLANNNTSDALDIGFYGQYDSTGIKYAGLARNAATDNFFLFKGLTADPAGNTLASGSVTAANAATLISNVAAFSITIGGQNIQTYTDNAFNTANAAFIKANTQDAINTTQNNSIEAAFTAANSAGVYANGAFAAANAATATDTTQNNSIAAAFTQANSNFVSAVTRLTVTHSGSSAYLIDQYSGNNPSIYISGGETLAFHLNNVTGHPFMIRVSSGGANFDTGLTHVANNGTVLTGSSAQGQVNGTLYWKVPFSIVGSTYVYQCSNHGGMVGNIVIQQPASFVAANTALAFSTANSAGVYANGAFAAANTDFTGITITAADHGSASAVAAFKVEANGRISSANSTVIAIAASAITSGTLGVTRGGTGAATFTNNGVLLGQGTSALTTASSATEGHVLTINASGVPTFEHLQGGTF